MYNSIYADAEVIPYAYTLDRTNALELIKQYVVIDQIKKLFDLMDFFL